MWSETALSVLLSLPPSFLPANPGKSFAWQRLPRCHQHVTLSSHSGIKYSFLFLTPSFGCDKSEKSESYGDWGGGRKQKLLWCFSCPLCIWWNVPFKWLVHLFSGVLWAEWQQLPAVTKWEVTLSVSLRVSSSPVWSLSLHCKNPLRQKQGYSMKCFCD